MNYLNKIKRTPLVREINWNNNIIIMEKCRDLYIDMLLFHRRLKSLVSVELKIGEFEAEYAGRMQLNLHIPKSSI